MRAQLKLSKHRKHDHFWIEEGVLYESYETIRGLRYMEIMKIDLPNNDRLAESDIEYIEENYLQYQ